MKVTGVTIVLAECLEADSKIKEAYQVYAESLDFLETYNAQLDFRHGGTLVLNDRVIPSEKKIQDERYMRTGFVHDKTRNAKRMKLLAADHMRNSKIALKLVELASAHPGLASSDEIERWLILAKQEAAIAKCQLDPPFEQASGTSPADTSGEETAALSFGVQSDAEDDTESLATSLQEAEEVHTNAESSDENSSEESPNDGLAVLPVEHWTAYRIDMVTPASLLGDFYYAQGDY